MGRIRVRWSAAGRVALLAGAALLAMQLAPALLEPPEPPPLAADVGLPRIAVEPEAALSRERAPRRPAHRGRRPPSLPPRRLAAKIDSKPKARPRRERRREQPAPAPDPAPATTPAAPPGPPPVAAPPAPVAPPPEPPPPPEDGSAEFAPR